jgi:mRNA-degrading endonuclease RelE of RelBE toxin-antitoxin system
MEIRYTEQFSKEFEKLDSSIKKEVLKKIERIIQNPHAGKPLQYTREKAERVKHLRIIFAVKGNILHFLDLDHRKEVYKKLK